MAVEGVVSFRISHESGGNGAAPKQFTLAQGEDKAIRIGRAPGNDILVEHRGVSQYHAEVRLAEGGSEPRLCIRDLSMNGTGLKRPGSETPSSCPKNTDDALPDGAVILVPMMLKADAQRAWLRVQILEGEEAAAAAAAKPPAPAKAPRSAAPAAPRKEAARAAPAPAAAAAASDGSSDDAAKEDAEKARVRFVELLLKTREVNAGTTYEAARELLRSSSPWHAVDEATRKECFEIFVEHLGNHANQKKDKKKDKKKKHKGDKEPQGDEAAPAKKEKKRKAEKARGGSDAEPERRKGKRKKEGAERRSRSRDAGRARGRARSASG